MKLNTKYSFDAKLLTNRPRHISTFDGALNANYQQVEAVAKVAEICGRHGLIYGKDWYWDTCHSERIFLSFSEEKYATMITLALNKGYAE